MLRTTLCVCLGLLAGVASGMSPDTLAQVTRSVVQVRVQIPVDGALSQEKALWTRLETFVGRKLLGTSIDLSSGTGFFVDTEGHLLTNAHVLSPDEADARLRRLIDTWQRYLGDEVPGTVLNTDEKFRLRVDFRKVFQKGTETVGVLVGGKQVPARTVSLNKGFDLALLEVSLDSPSSPLRFEPTTSPPEVGSEVTAIGYPLAYVLDSLFEQSSATATQGTVSALRSELWSIQHTAALNPGNSGGPLVNAQGRAVGVNVGLITASNGLYYALPTKTVEAFLTQAGQQTLWVANQALGSRSVAAGPQVETVGEKVFLDSEGGTQVSRGSQRLGDVPLVLTLTDEITVIHLESPRGEATLTLKRDDAIRQVKTLVVALHPFQVAADLQTLPAGAELFVDGLPIGKAPLKINLAVGRHSFTAKLSGYEYPMTELLVEKSGSPRLALTGQPLTNFVFDKPLPTGTKFVLLRTADQARRTFTDPESIPLPPGRWEGQVENQGILKPTRFLLDTAGAAQVSTGEWYERARFSVLNVKPGSTLLIDGEVQSASPTDGQVYEVAAGEHRIQVTLPHHFPFEKTLRVASNRAAVLTVLQEATPELNRSNRLWTGGMLVAGGLLVGAIDVAYLSTQPQLFSSPLKEEVPVVAYVAGYSFLGALVSSFIGVLFLLGSGK